MVQRVDDEWVRRVWSGPHSQTFWVDGNGRVARQDGRLRLDPTADAGPYDPERCYFLGLEEKNAVFATLTQDETMSLASLRGVLDDIPDGEVPFAFAAVALAGWHAGARFCPACGTPTQAAQGGHVRLCAKCPRELFPRTDPAVIVAVRDASDRLLLGRQPVWEPRRMSVFAGFVEVGESLEQAVHREVAEEVGLRLTDVRYVSSQPWPFPCSLMLAFSARTADAAVTVDHTEIELARWFTREEYRVAIAAGEVTPPSSHSVARVLIRDWLAGALPVDTRPLGGSNIDG